jgi:TRAP-type C4-dicarboxylate transport system permease large subunit
MGRVALPEMKRYNYDDSLATGCVAAAGSLGIMLAGLFIAVVVILCKRNPNLAPGGAPTTFKQKLSGLAGGIEMLVLFVLVTEMGVITPPVGLNVYVIKGVAEDVPLETIFKGVFPFLAALIVAVIILMIFPQIATFLPGLTLY